MSTDIAGDPPANRFQVVVTAPGLAAEAAALLQASGCRIHYMPPYPSEAAIAQTVADAQADAILCRMGRINAAVLLASKRLRIVARHGVGVDDVDIAAARAAGVLVTRAPGSNTRAVAEHAVALIFALIKRLPALSAGIAEGGWRGGSTAEVGDIAGMRLGLVGFGAVGQAVGRFAQGFAMPVTAFDPATEDAAFAGITRATSLPALLAEADILSLHCPLLPATRHLIDAAALARLPAGALVVNTARGGIIDEAALEAALDAGHLAGAALDVFEGEPPRADHPLRRHPKVIATPHVAGVTPASLVTMGVMAAECIVAALTGGTVPPNRIVS